MEDSMHDVVRRTALSGRSQSSHDKVTRGLGYFSIALGVAELVAPGAICRAAGVRGLEPVVRGYGAREIATGDDVRARASEGQKPPRTVSVRQLRGRQVHFQKRKRQTNTAAQATMASTTVAVNGLRLPSAFRACSISFIEVSRLPLVNVVGL